MPIVNVNNPWISALIILEDLKDGTSRKKAPAQAASETRKKPNNGIAWRGMAPPWYRYGII
jgi:hypothetical protein